MKIKIVLTPNFEQEKDSLLKKRKLLQEDYDDFKRDLAARPTRGEVIQRTGGARKARLQSAFKGKRGGFRVCYFYHQQSAIIILLVLYPKNAQEDLTTGEIKYLKQITTELKGKFNG